MKNKLAILLAVAAVGTAGVASVTAFAADGGAIAPAATTATQAPEGTVAVTTDGSGNVAVGGKTVSAGSTASGTYQLKDDANGVATLSAAN
ncbi:MAG: hypothetical protein LBN08_00395 [Lactobacillales bacterium]|jgi:hypothetical protein|nr:hypothetical protein [Lactobacillales bacterium]